MIKFHRLLLPFCLICCLSHQAYAEVPVVDESDNFAMLDEQQAGRGQSVAKAQYNEKYSDEETPLARDQQSSNLSDNAELLNKIQGLQQDIQELRGQLEVQAHDLKLLQQQQLAFYKDLDARLRTNPAKPTQTSHLSAEEQPTDLSLAANTIAAKASDRPKDVQVSQEKIVDPINIPRSNPADEQISYLAAYDLVKNKRFDEALSAMQAFVNHYPQGGYTANAHYWLGELYMVKNNYPKAIDHFDIVLKQFPSSSKAAACTLKIGYALAASGREAEAKMRLHQVIKTYPDTPTAQLAMKKLESLGIS